MILLFCVFLHSYYVENISYKLIFEARISEKFSGNFAVTMTAHLLRYAAESYYFVSLEFSRPLVNWYSAKFNSAIWLNVESEVEGILKTSASSSLLLHLSRSSPSDTRVPPLSRFVPLINPLFLVKFLRVPSGPLRYARRPRRKQIYPGQTFVRESSSSPLKNDRNLVKWN